MVTAMADGEGGEGGEGNVETFNNDDGEKNRYMTKI